MGLRLRKFIGLICLLVYMAIYIAAAIILAPAIIPADAKLLEILYFAVAGIIWIIPAGWIIRWMQRPA